MIRGNTSVNKRPSSQNTRKNTAKTGTKTISSGTNPSKNEVLYLDLYRALLLTLDYASRHDALPDR